MIAVDNAEPPYERVTTLACDEKVPHEDGAFNSRLRVAFRVQEQFAGVVGMIAASNAATCRERFSQLVARYDRGISVKNFIAGHVWIVSLFRKDRLGYTFQ
jgi:hypothetical protein